MRIGIVATAVLVLLVAGAASAGTISSAAIPDEAKQNAPPGSYWDEELGGFVFDPPIPIQMPGSMTLEEWENYDVMLYYDEGLMGMIIPQMDDRLAATKFPTPECAGSYFKLQAAMYACYGDVGVPVDDDERAVVYAHTTSPGCLPWGDQLGQEFVSQPFTHTNSNNGPNGEPVMVKWTYVALKTPYIVNASSDPDFWLCLDYRPGHYYYEPDGKGGYYTLGLPMEPEVYRFFETVDEEGCISPITGYGPWLIRGLGRCLGQGKDDEDPFDVDAKPTSCPNPFTFGRETSAISVAIVGEGEPYPVAFEPGYPPEDECFIDVTPGMIWMEGPGGEAYPLPDRFEVEDVVSPWTGVPDPSSECANCTTEGPDLILDLTMKFEAADVGNVLYSAEGLPPEEGACVQVEIHYSYTSPYDGETIDYVGYECFRVHYSDTGDKKGGGDPTIGAVRIGDANMFALHQNTPNPFRDETTISFSLPTSSHTSLTVHDVSGRTVATLVNGDLSAGTHAVEWNANVPSGVYFCRLVAGGETAGARMVVAR